MCLRGLPPPPLLTLICRHGGTRPPCGQQPSQPPRLPERATQVRWPGAQPEREREREEERERERERETGARNVKVCGLTDCRHAHGLKAPMRRRDHTATYTSHMHTCARPHAHLRTCAHTHLHAFQQHMRCGPCPCHGRVPIGGDSAAAVVAPQRGAPQGLAAGSGGRGWGHERRLYV